MHGNRKCLFRQEAKADYSVGCLGKENPKETVQRRAKHDASEAKEDEDWGHHRTSQQKSTT
jgi:hypothetical protein